MALFSLRTHRLALAPAGIAILVGALALGAASWPQPVPTMDQAAARFLDSLTIEQRSTTVFPYDSPKRLDWHFVPRNRPGLLLKDMTDAQRTRAHDLLRSALSSAGYLKAVSIMSLDAVLHDLEVAAGGSGAARDPLFYSFAVFGDPSKPESPWGWKVEGHHLSLNFSSPSRELTATTPSFFGAHPAHLGRGPRAGLRVLAAEEDLARALLDALDESGRKQAVFSDRAPPDIILGPGRQFGGIDFGPDLGLAATAMTEPQRALLKQLVQEFARSLRPDLADAHLARIAGAGWDQLRFAWAGGLSRGEPHYYRITGPTFIIEYDNTQDRANHIHTVWHDLEHDFGADPLRDHLQRDHGR